MKANTPDPEKQKKFTLTCEHPGAPIIILADGKEWMVLAPSPHQQEIADMALRDLNHAFYTAKRYEAIMAGSIKRYG